MSDSPPPFFPLSDVLHLGEQDEYSVRFQATCPELDPSDSEWITTIDRQWNDVDNPSLSSYLARIREALSQGRVVNLTGISPVLPDVGWDPDALASICATSSELRITVQGVSFAFFLSFLVCDLITKHKDARLRAIPALSSLYVDSTLKTFMSEEATSTEVRAALDLKISALPIPYPLWYVPAWVLFTIFWRLLTDRYSVLWTMAWRALFLSSDCSIRIRTRLLIRTSSRCAPGC